MGNLGVQSKQILLEPLAHQGYLQLCRGTDDDLIALDSIVAMSNRAS